MKTTQIRSIILLALVSVTSSLFSQTKIDISTLNTTTPLTTAGSPYTITGDNTASPATVGYLLTIGGGQNVTVILDNITYVTANTDIVTKLIDCNVGPKATVNIILKGKNVVDFQSVKKASTCIGMTGSGSYIISEDPSHGSLTMKVLTTGTGAQVLGFFPGASAKTASLSVSGGEFTNEYTGKRSIGNGHVLTIGGTGCWSASIAGGKFTTLCSAGGANSGNVLLLSNVSVETTANKTCSVTGGTFTAQKGSVVRLQGSSTGSFSFFRGRF